MFDHPILGLCFCNLLTFNKVESTFLLDQLHSRVLNKAQIAYSLSETNRRYSARNFLLALHEFKSLL